jgi:hypothetical protein
MSIVTPLFGLALLTSPVQQDQVAPEPLQCMAGPIQRSFGGTEWLTYGCADHLTLIVVSAPGNPAMPFVFVLSKANGGVRISGEGNGDQKATAPAFEDLKKVSIQVLDQMLREAEAHP